MKTIMLVLVLLGFSGCGGTISSAVTKEVCRKAKGRSAARPSRGPNPVTGAPMVGVGCVDPGPAKGGAGLARAQHPISANSSPTIPTLTLMPTDSGTSAIDKLRMVRSDYDQETRLHRFWIDSYTGGAGSELGASLSRPRRSGAGTRTSTATGPRTMGITGSRTGLTLRRTGTRTRATITIACVRPCTRTKSSRSWT